MNKIKLIRGDTLELVIPSIKYTDTGADYVLKPTDVVVFAVKKHPYDASECIRKEVTIDDVVEGKLQIFINPSDTVNMECGKYFFDVRLVVDDKHIYTVIPSSEFEINTNIAKIGE